MLCDWLVVGQVIATNPAAPVRGPRHVVRKGKTPVLTAEEAHAARFHSRRHGRRDADRALIALMVYTFARVGAVIKMRSEDVYVQGRRTWVRLHEKGGKRHEMPCHHSLDAYLTEYIEAADVGDEPKSWLFRSTRARTGELTDNPLSQADVYRMIRAARSPPASARRSAITPSVPPASPSTCATAASSRSRSAWPITNRRARPGLYDRRDDQVSLDEVERILI